jgi:hypothetical protein
VADPAGAEAESARLEMEQIEMARVDLAPIDLAALAADDELIDALAAGRLSGEDLTPEPVGPDDELIAMLAAWVADVQEPVSRPSTPAAAPGDPRPSPSPQPRSAPRLPAAPSVAVGVGEDGGAGSARTTLARADPRLPARRPLAPAADGHGRHRSRAVPYPTRVAAAALLVIASSGAVAIGSYEATPGETLWTISKVLHEERARSVLAAAEVSDALAQARLAIREGRAADAERAMEVAAARLPDVRTDEGHDQLAAERQSVVDDLVVLVAPGASPTPTSGPAWGPLAAAPTTSAAPAAPTTTAPTTTEQAGTTSAGTGQVHAAQPDPADTADPALADAVRAAQIALAAIDAAVNGQHSHRDEESTGGPGSGSSTPTTTPAQSLPAEPDPAQPDPAQPDDTPTDAAASSRPAQAAPPSPAPAPPTPPPPTPRPTLPEPGRVIVFSFDPGEPSDTSGDSTSTDATPAPPAASSDPKAAEEEPEADDPAAAAEQTSADRDPAFTAAFGFAPGRGLLDDPSAGGDRGPRGGGR